MQCDYDDMTIMNMQYFDNDNDNDNASTLSDYHLIIMEPFKSRCNATRSTNVLPGSFQIGVDAARY